MEWGFGSLPSLQVELDPNLMTEFVLDGSTMLEIPITLLGFDCYCETFAFKCPGGSVLSLNVEIRSGFQFWSK